MRFLTLLVLICLMGFVSGECTPASTSFKDNFCSASEECCDDVPYCWGNGALTKTCHSDKGSKGKHCSNGIEKYDIDCVGTLVCANLGGNSICSECRAGDYSILGVLWEGSQDEPNDDVCKYPGHTCSCRLTHSNSDSYLRYARWGNKDDDCDICNSMTECYEDLRCSTASFSGGMYCSDLSSFECCFDRDCPGDEFCVDDACVDLSPPDSSTITTSTSTTSTTTSTTTTLVSGFNCMVLVNVSAAADDGYEVAEGNLFTENRSQFVGNWVGGGSIVAYNESTDLNHSLGFIFRNVSLPRNVEDIESSIFVNIKAMENFGYLGTCTGGSAEVNTGDLSNSTKPSTIDYYREIERSSCSGGTCTASVSSGCGSSVETGLNDTWYGEFGFVDVDETVKYYNEGQWRSGDNLTIIMNLYGFDRDTLFYSFEDDPTKAARLCLNYTLLSIPTFTDECDVDSDCLPYMWCVQGFQESSFCIDKKDDYFVDNGYFCFRNHECKSGHCSSHADNVVAGDYPVWNASKGIPYDFQGQCLPSSYSIDVGPSPSVIVIGQSFDVWGSLLSDSNPVGNGNCNIFLDYLIPLNPREDFEGVAWGGNLVDGFNWSIGHSMDFAEATKWTHKTSNSLVTTPVAGGMVYREGDYKVWFLCSEPSGHLVGKDELFRVRFFNYTSIEFLDSPKSTIIKDSTHTIAVSFTNVTGKPLMNASCSANVSGSLYPMTESGVLNPRYSADILFNESGSMSVQISCNHSFYVSRSTSGSFSVHPSSCTNGFKDVDEGGVDCGGECLPCGDSGLDLDFSPCISDVTCLSGWCNLESGHCASASCYDGSMNQGEVRIDCGGPICDPCPSCLQNNDCSVDGSQYCDSSDFNCVVQNCDSDSDCYSLDWWIPVTETYMQRQTFCDTDSICRFNIFQQENQTISEIGVDILPLSGLTVNKSGTIFHVFNCDDKNNGFVLSSNEKTTVTYSIASNPYSPSIGPLITQRIFSTSEGKQHRGMIPELCGSNFDGEGGLGETDLLLYARLNFRSCDKDSCLNTLVDTVTFKNNLENSHIVYLNNSVDSSLIYGFNASGRDIMLFVRSTTHNEWINVSPSHLTTQLFDKDGFGDELDRLDSFLYRINSSFGEVFEGQQGDLFFMPLKFDRDTRWFKLGFDVEGWMIIPVFAVLIVFVAYLNYKGRRREVRP